LTLDVKKSNSSNETPNVITVGVENYGLSLGHLMEHICDQNQRIQDKKMVHFHPNIFLHVLVIPKDSQRQQQKSIKPPDFFLVSFFFLKSVTENFSSPFLPVFHIVFLTMNS
jgi:hypothetical protein